MSPLEELYRKIESVADYSGITITGPNTRGLFDTYPLAVAAIWGDGEAIRMLIDAGAEVNQPGEHGYTALHEAAAQGHFDAVKLLIELGAKPAPSDDGWLPSDAATNYPHINAWLLERGF